MRSQMCTLACCVSVMCLNTRHSVRLMLTNVESFLFLFYSSVLHPLSPTRPEREHRFYWTCWPSPGFVTKGELNHNCPQASFTHFRWIFLSLLLSAGLFYHRIFSYYPLLFDFCFTEEEAWSHLCSLSTFSVSPECL